jgi:hypothetical protein
MKERKKAYLRNPATLSSFSRRPPHPYRPSLVGRSKGGGGGGV